MSAIDKIQTAQIANLYGIINSGSIPVYPPANDIVTITGNQTITGDKVFTGTVNAPTVDVLDDSTSVATTEWVKDYVPTITGGFVTASANNNFTGINSFVNPITPTITTFDGIDMSGNDIIQVDNIDLVTINGSAYPPVVIDPSLNTVLTAGNTATNSIILDNSGTGTNLISLLPNFSANNPHIELTDGTTTNRIDKNGYTTRNSVQNSTHFLNFSDASTTGIGSIQKTSGIECNPSTKTITATTFVGDLSGNATSATTASGATDITITDSTSTAGTFYPTFVNSAGTNKSVRIDTTGLTYSPSTDTLTATNFSGTATTSTNIAGGAGGSIPYQSSANNTALLANGTAGQVLQSNGTTLAPSWVTPSTSATTVDITNTTAPTAGTYYPTFVSASGSGQTLRADITGVIGGLRYTPISNLLEITDGTETVSISPSSIAGASSMSSNNITAFTQLQIAGVGTFTTSGISFQQILSFSSAGQGVLEKSVVSTAGFTLTTANAFQTIVSSTASVRTYVLPAPTAGTAGYWYGFCNKASSAGNTIIVQYPSGTTLFTLAGGVPTIGNCARVAVVAGGASYFSPSQ